MTDDPTPSSQMLENESVTGDSMDALLMHGVNDFETRLLPSVAASVGSIGKQNQGTVGHGPLW